MRQMTAHKEALEQEGYERRESQRNIRALFDEWELGKKAVEEENAMLKTENQQLQEHNQALVQRLGTQVDEPLPRCSCCFCLVLHAKCHAQ